MAEYNMGRIVAGIKAESTNGTAVTLLEADYNVMEIDAELIQYQADTSPVGKAATGSLINKAKSYSRTKAGTGAVKIELKGSATPAVAPNYGKYLDVAGFKTGVISPATEWGFYYDGKPTCKTCTRVTYPIGCDGENYKKTIKGAIITGGKITMSGVGAPLEFSGSFSGAFVTPTTNSTEINVTDDAGESLQPIGAVVLIGAQAYNITKLEYNTNLTGVMVTDHQDASLVSHFRFAEGDPSLTFSAIPLDPTADWADVLADTVATSWTFETAGVFVTIEDVQITDIQDTNEGGLLIQDMTVKCGAFSAILK